MKNKTFTVKFHSPGFDGPRYFGPFYTEDEAYDYVDEGNGYLAAAGIPSTVASYGVCDA